MQFRTLAAAALVPLLALAACDDNGDLTGTGGSNKNATVRFINVTTTTFDIASNGSVTTGNGALGYGTSSACISADASNSGLAVRQTGTSTPLTGFTPSFTAGGNYTVLVYPGVGGTTQFATVSNAYAPPAGQAGLRVFNAAGNGTNYDVYVTAPGAVLTTPNVNNVGFGSGSSYFNVSGTSAQQVRIMNAGSQAVLLDIGNQTFTAGTNATLVIAPPITGSTTPRAFLVQGCAATAT
jgi:hypothetical protein